MIEILVGVGMGVLLGTITAQKRMTRSGAGWRPASTQEVRRKLKKEGILEQFLDGQYKCPVCETTITFDNLWSIMEERGEKDFICREQSCFKTYLMRIHEFMITH